MRGLREGSYPSRWEKSLKDRPEGHAAREVYQTEGNENVVAGTLESMVREGARRMLAADLEEEVNGFLGRERYERGEEFRRYRNGYLPSRELTVGVSAVEVKVPRVWDVPAEVSADGIESKIVKRYERTGRQTQDLFRKLYMEGLSTGDFEPVFREMSVAPTRSERERLRDEYVVDLSADGRTDAAETVVRNWDSLVSFYDFPVERWAHLRTTNPLEWVFSAVRLRTDVAKRMKRRDSALYLVFKVELRLSKRWRPLNGGTNLMGLLVDETRFEDGILTELPLSAEEAVAA